MRNNLNLGKGEAGMALVLVTIILMLSAFIVPPLLQLNFSGTRSAQISEDKALRLYAADAGVEDALYQLKYGVLDSGTGKNYVLTSDMNRSAVDVSINDIGSWTYKITSKAVSIGGGETTIESYVAFSADYSSLADYAAVTAAPDDEGEVENEGTIIGDVSGWKLENEGTITGDVSYNELEGGGTINGTVTSFAPPPYWPTADELKDFYWEDVQGSVPYGSEELDISGGYSAGPFYRDGELEITGNGQLTLEGTMYITGDLDIDLESGGTINLNGHTIFVEGEVDVDDEAISLLGPGAIIAIGELEIAPKMENDGFIFLMSVEDEVEVTPYGDFYGTLAAYEEAEVEDEDDDDDGDDDHEDYPGGRVINNKNAPVLNIPGMVEGGREITSIFTYNITNES